MDEIEPAHGVPRTITEALGEELTESHQTVASYGGVGGSHSPMHHGHGGKASEVDSFHQVSHNPFLLVEGIDIHPDALPIEANRQLPGRIDAVTGDVEFDDLAPLEIDDALDDLGALALKMRGEVVVVPTERMPSETGIAAIYRY